MSHHTLAIRGGPPRPYLGSRQPAPCKFFQADRCRSGDACTFSHETAMNPVTATAATTSTNTTTAVAIPRMQPQPSPAVVCKFFVRGSCRSGDSCVFVHPEHVAPPTTEKSSDGGGGGGNVDGDGDGDGEDKKDDYTRTLAGALVKFGNGAQVKSIVLASDFTAVRLSVVPRSVTPASIIDFIKEKGFTVTADDVRMQPGSVMHATVRCVDKNFARSACAGGWCWPTGEPVQATPIGTPMPPGHSARRVDYKKLHVSWHKGTKTASLAWSKHSVGAKVIDLYTSGAYTVLGKKVELEKASSLFIRLLNIPCTATKDDILAGIKAPYHHPKTILFSEASHTASPEEACIIVQSLFTAVGPLEYWEMTLESTARRVKATARFLDEADAGRAVKKLDNSPLPFFPAGKLTVSLVYSAKFKVGRGVYNAVKTRVLKSAQEWREKDSVHFYAYPPSDALGRFRVLKIEAEAPDKVIAARGQLDAILDGVVAKDKEGHVLWHASLGGNGKLYRDIMSVAKETKVIITRDKIRSELRILGPEQDCNATIGRLQSLFGKIEKAQAYSVILDKDQLGWVCRGGAKAILEALGQDKVMFDVVSTPKRIAVTGSLEDFDIVQRMVSTRLLQNSRAEATDNNSDNDCAVCWCPPDQPVRTPCGHVYCGECFETSCLSAPASASGLQVSCHGDASTCNALVPLSFIQGNLASGAFEDLLDKSFNSHVQRHMDVLRFCPTPRCGHVQRVADEDPTERICSGCFARTCSGCGSEDVHPGYTCGEWRAAKAGTDEGTKKLRQELGIKDCPKCGVGIEKTMGCNHMTCGVCGTHMCWVCMETFGMGAEVYRHMERKHGGHITYE